MATVTSTTQLDAVLKELYPGNLPAEIMQHNHPFLAMVPKSGDAYGEYIVIPYHYDLPGGRSADIATVLDSTGPISSNKVAKANVTLVEDYAASWIDALTMKKMENDRGAFVKARKFEVDGLIKACGNSTAHGLFRSGTGSIGQILDGSAINGATITLANSGDAKFFRVGMQLQFSATDGSALRDSGDYVTVTKVDMDASSAQITTDSADIGTSIASLADTDFIYARGDRNEKITGLAGWIPLASPSATAFFGMDRSVHPTRLAGNRLDESGANAEDSILKLGYKMFERGARPDVCLVSPRQFAAMAKRMNAKVAYDDAGGMVKYGFGSINIYCAGGMVRVFADPDCPDTLGYMLTLNTWKLYHLEGLPHIVTDDGLTSLRRSASDSVEIRVRQYLQLACLAPGENGVFSCSLT